MNPKTPSVFLKKWIWAIGIAAISVIAINWLSQPVAAAPLVFDVPAWSNIAWLESPYLYAGLMVFTVCFPFLASFERKRVHYFSQWNYLWKGSLIIGLAFIFWDAYFTKIGIWGFNADYLSGFHLLGLPWEEWAFFICVPFSCLFIYEVLNFSFPDFELVRADRFLSIFLIFLFFATGIFFWEKMYTATTFLLCGFSLTAHYLFGNRRVRSQFYRMYLVSWLPFLLVNGVLTGAFSAHPVVVYNPEEFMGIRILTIPVEDSAYSFLLLLGNVVFFEYARGKKTNPPSAKDSCHSVV